MVWICTQEIFKLSSTELLAQIKKEIERQRKMEINYY